MNPMTILLILVAAWIAFNLVRNLLGTASGETVAKLLKESPVVLDVRTSGEFQSGHVPGALHLPLSDFAQRLESVAPDKTRPLLLYCASGARSGAARRQAQSLGYANAHNLGSLHRAQALLDRKQS
jgi:phage shock protein E